MFLINNHSYFSVKKYFILDLDKILDIILAVYLNLLISLYFLKIR